MGKTPHPNDTENDVAQDARRLAELLGAMLQASSFSDAEKEAWSALVPEMRLDQLLRFAKIVDASVTKKAEEELQPLLQNVRTILERHAAIAAQIDHDFTSGLSDLVAKVRQAERNDHRV